MSPASGARLKPVSPVPKSRFNKHKWVPGTDYVMPVLQGEEAVELMKLAGIWTKSGKLSKRYR